MTGFMHSWFCCRRLLLIGRRPFWGQLIKLPCYLTATCRCHWFNLHKKSFFLLELPGTWYPASWFYTGFCCLVHRYSGTIPALYLIKDCAVLCLIKEVLLYFVLLLVKQNLVLEVMYLDTRSVVLSSAWN